MRCQLGAMPAARPAFVTSAAGPNPGPMTLDGTNTWLLRAPGAGVLRWSSIPGPDDDEHLAAIVGGRPDRGDHR